MFLPKLEHSQLTGYRVRTTIVVPDDPKLDNEIYHGILSIRGIKIDCIYSELLPTGKSVYTIVLNPNCDSRRALIRLDDGLGKIIKEKSLLY